MHSLSNAPFEKLLARHPSPWQEIPHPRWRGAEPPMLIVVDANGNEIAFDDTDWSSALVQAVNLASGHVLSNGCSLLPLTPAYEGAGPAGGE